MAISSAIKDIVRTPAARRAWITAQLRLRGVSMLSLARRLGVSRQAVSQAMIVASERIQEAIAAELGLAVQDLFPEFYDPVSGERTAKRNPTAGQRRRNVEDREVA